MNTNTLEKTQSRYQSRHYSRLFLRKSKGDIAFEIVLYILVTLICFGMLYPFLYMFSVSVSEYKQIYNVRLLPRGLTFAAYKFVFRLDNIQSGFKNSILYAVIGVMISMALTIPMAYALSKKFLYGRSVLSIFVLITMYFSGGLIPTYVWLTNGLNMGDTFWVMVIPAAVNTYNMIVMRTYFVATISTEMQEAAEIDGCGQLRMLFLIYLPLSTPIIATISLFYFVASWNSWFGAQIYLKTESKYPIQLILKKTMETSLGLGLGGGLMQEMMQAGISSDSLQYALTICVTLPLVLLFPFFQRFFTKGIILGSLKG